MNLFQIGFAALSLAFATLSLSSAGTPKAIASPRGGQVQAWQLGGAQGADLARSLPAIGSPKASRVSQDRQQPAGTAMDCCAAILGSSVAGSPRSGNVPAPPGVKCSMGAQAGAKTGCCAPTSTAKAPCCG